MKAYARLNDATAALDLLAEFQQEGGRPDERMISMGVTACVRAGEFKQALKVSNLLRRQTSVEGFTMANHLSIKI